MRAVNNLIWPCMLVLALTNCLYEKNSCIITSLPITSVVECSTWDQEVPGLSPIACLFVCFFTYLFVLFVFVYRGSDITTCIKIDISPVV